ncbi:MAG TPA: hypothetical protein PKJ83_13935 [Cyclobacteriaceae bacterium]|nr:hypothetical protein [Cyclobacteriaceae bacterium]HPW63874.1 hypothetical protein [Cyclobacteriaceae bacterium]
MKYSTLDFLGGIRHYFLVGKEFKIFLNGYYNLVSAVIVNEFQYGTGQVGLNPGSYFGLGVGSEFKKIGLEVRYFTPRNLFKNNEEWPSGLSAIAFIIGYRFF